MQLKGCLQELPVHFWKCSFKNSWILAHGICFTWETLLWSFFAGLVFVFEKKKYEKNSVFQTVSFGDLLLNEKQIKEIFVEQQTGRTIYRSSVFDCLVISDVEVRLYMTKAWLLIITSSNHMLESAGLNLLDFCLRCQQLEPCLQRKFERPLY